MSDAPAMDTLRVRPVTPSDLYLYLEGWTYANVFDADDDGVTVVPLARAETVLAEAQKKLQFEADVLERLARGEDTSDLFPLPEIEYIG